jgi:hypothetical protein
MQQQEAGDKKDSKEGNELKRARAIRLIFSEFTIPVLADIVYAYFEHAEFMAALSFYNKGTHYNSEDLKEAFKQFLAASSQGHPCAEFYLFKCYHNGFGTLREDDRAFQIFRLQESRLKELYEQKKKENLVDAEVNFCLAESMAFADSNSHYKSFVWRSSQVTYRMDTVLHRTLLEEAIAQGHPEACLRLADSLADRMNSSIKGNQLRNSLVLIIRLYKRAIALEVPGAEAALREIKTFIRRHRNVSTQLSELLLLEQQRSDVFDGADLTAQAVEISLTPPQ